MTMARLRLSKLRSQRGVSIVEILLAAFLTGLIVAAGMEFYSEMSGQSTVQVDLSNAQLICRNSLQDIKKSLRMAGYKVGSHAPYEINGDTLSVYVSQTQPVDTITYYLLEFTDAQYSVCPNLPAGRRLWKLMRSFNSNSAEILSDYVTGIEYTVLDSANVIVQIGSQTEHSDESLEAGNGYRTYSLVERVSIRNLTI
jgi:hypothetical protein